MLHLVLIDSLCYSTDDFILCDIFKGQGWLNPEFLLLFSFLFFFMTALQTLNPTNTVLFH